VVTHQLEFDQQLEDPELNLLFEHILTTRILR
jgi:hypothetical protein